MKHIAISIALLISALSAASCGMFAPKNEKEQKAVAKEVATSIKNMHMVIDIDQVDPVGMETIFTDNAYQIKFYDGKIKALLPYFGQTFSFRPGAPMEIIFDEAEYRIAKKNHKRSSGIYEINLEAKGKDMDNYKIQMTISESGFATINITCASRSRMNYSGNLRILGIENADADIKYE